MIGQNPFGGIYCTGQSTAQAVTTSAAKLSITGTLSKPGTADRVGDPAVKPDPTNDQLYLNAPGLYRVTLQISGSAASALQTTHQLRKNGTAYGGVSKKTWGTTPDTVELTEYVEVLKTDVNSSSNPTFADPDSSAGAGKPAGGFAGAGAAPKTGISLDSIITGDGSVNFTPTDIRFFAERIG